MHKETTAEPGTRNPQVNKEIIAIDRLNAHAWHIRSFDQDLSEQEGLEGLRRSEKIDYLRGIASALTTLAYNDMRHARYAEGKEKGERGLELHRRAGNREGEGWSHFMLGVLSRWTNSLEEGVEHYDRAIEIAGEIGREEIKAFALNGLGNIFHHKGKIAAARDYFTRCLEAAMRANDPEGTILGHFGIGTTWLEQGNYDEAIRQYRMGEEIALRIGHRSLQHTLTEGLSTILRYSGDFAGALRYKLEAVRWEESRKEWRPLLGSYLGIADTYLSLGDYGLALETLHDGLGKAWEHGLQDLEGMFNLRIGILYEAVGENAYPVEYYLRALSLAELTGDYLGIISALFYLGRLYRQKGDIPKALAYYFRCLRMGEENDFAEAIRSSLQAIGNAYLSMKRYEEARDYFHRSLAVAEETGDSAGRARTAYALGVFEMNAGNHDRAEDLMLQSLEFFRNAGDREYQLHVFKHLIELAKLSGAEPEARRYHQERQDLSRSIFSSEATRRVRSLIAGLEASHARHEGKRLGLEDEDLQRIDDISNEWSPLYAESPGALVEPGQRNESAGPTAVAPEDPASTPAMIDIRTFGAFRVEQNGTEVPRTAWQRKRARDLFKLLLIRHRSVVTVAEIEESLWGRPMEKIESLVMNAVSHIRRALSLQAERRDRLPSLVRNGDGYLLDLGDDLRIDFVLFQELIVAARRSEGAEERKELYTKALDLYYGPFLAEETYAEWTDNHRRLLTDAWFEAAEYLARDELRSGRYNKATAHAREILGREGTSESAWQVLLQSLTHLGRHGDVLAEYERCIRIYRKELDEDPPTRLREIAARNSAADSS